MEGALSNLSLRLIMVTAAVWLGCGGDAGVSLALELPDDGALDPLDERVSGLTLTVSTAGAPIYSASRAFSGPGEPVDFGRVPTGEALTFELAGRTAAARVIAYGRSALPVQVSGDASTSVSVRVRRPYVYLAGAADLVTVDATQEPGHDYAAAVTTGAIVRAAGVTPDGAQIVLATDTELMLVATTSHRSAAAAPVAIAAAARDLALSPDSRWAVISHTDPQDPLVPSGVSVVDLHAAAAGDARAVRFVATGVAGELAASNTTAWLIQDPLASLFCMGESSLVAIDLETAEARAPVALEQAATDLTITTDDDGDRVFVTLPCANQVREVAGGVVAPGPFLEVAGASALSVAHGRLWAMGHIDGEAAHLILASTRLDGSDLRVLDFPTLEERALAPELAGPGQDGLVRMTADLASAFDLAVLPDGEHVAILVAAVYLTTPSGDAGGGQPILPEVRMITYEYQLAQLATGLAAQRLRTTCAIEWEPGALIDQFTCAQAPGQDISPIDFVPTNLSALFGSH